MARYTPIIITSARSSEVHRILGLELGADDYLAKPFSMLELVARVRALLRRSDALARNRMDAGTLELHGLAIDPVARTALLDGRALDLTPREFDLLHFFARHPDKVYSRLDLLNQVWGYQHEGYEHTVNTHINRLRTKIEDDPSEPRRILTVWGAATSSPPRRRRGMIKRLSLTQRLSAVFALLLLACCGASAWLQMAANARYEQEVVQRLSGGLAGHIAGANELMDAQGWKPEAVRALFDKLMAVNPAVEVYLLDLDGRVVGDAAPPGQPAGPCRPGAAAARAGRRHAAHHGRRSAQRRRAQGSAWRRRGPAARTSATFTWCCRARPTTSWPWPCRAAPCCAPRCGRSRWWRCWAWSPAWPPSP